MASPPALVIPASKQHTATVICSHGLGDTGQGWAWLAEGWQTAKKFPEVKWIFPTAPTIPITANMRMRMPGWYDIVSFEGLSGRSEDETGILRSRDYIHSLISTEVARGTPPDRIVVGGFSQGAAISVLSGLTFASRLAGIFSLSGYLLLPDKVETMTETGVNKPTKIFWGHGTQDPLVRYSFGEMSVARLRELGYGVDFRSYQNLVHSVSPEEIDDLEAYLMQQLPSKPNIAQPSVS